MSFIAAPRNLCEIRLDHLVENFRRLTPKKNTFCCPMVKADAYGHGAIEVSKALAGAGANQLGVMFPEEGIELRQAGVELPILVYGGIEKNYLKEIEVFRLTPVVSDWEQIKDLESLELKSALGVHLKVDSGMHRLGFQPEEARRLFDVFWKNKKLRIAGILTHLSHGHDVGESTGHSGRQLSIFTEFAAVFAAFKPKLHCFASSSLLALESKENLSEVEQSWVEQYGVRLGLSLYGVSPQEDVDPLDLKPVMMVKSHLVALQSVRSGESVSYEGTWTAPKDSLVGVVPFGYADGLPRLAFNKIQFRIGDKCYPQVGTICMDYCMVDLGDTRNDFKVGEEVVIFDDQAPTRVIEVAKAAQTIPYEVMTGLGRRVQRKYIK